VLWALLPGPMGPLHISPKGRLALFLPELVVMFPMVKSVAHGTSLCQGRFKAFFVTLATAALFAAAPKPKMHLGHDKDAQSLPEAQSGKPKDIRYQPVPQDDQKVGRLQKHANGQDDHPHHLEDPHDGEPPFTESPFLVCLVVFHHFILLDFPNFLTIGPWPCSFWT